METSYYTSNYWKWCDAKKKTFVVSDVGEYSLFINKNLKDVLYFRIKTKHSSWYEPTQIVSTEAGFILYFNECIKDVFKSGCIYPARIVNRFKWSVKKVTTQDLIKAFNYIFLNSKDKEKKKIKHKAQFQPYHMYDWELEIVSTASEEPKRRRCRRNKQLINQTQDGK